MMKSISDLNEMEIPKGGLNCTVKGYFFYRIAEGETNDALLPRCYISEADGENSSYIGMSVNIGETVLSDDETFGMIVGGKYAYYGLLAIVAGIVDLQDDELVFSKIESLRLEKDGLSQDFQFHG